VAGSISETFGVRWQAMRAGLPVASMSHTARQLFGGSTVDGLVYDAGFVQPRLGRVRRARRGALALPDIVLQAAFALCAWAASGPSPACGWRCEEQPSRNPPCR